MALTRRNPVLTPLPSRPSKRLVPKQPAGPLQNPRVIRGPGITPTPTTPPVKATPIKPAPGKAPTPLKPKPGTIIGKPPGPGSTSPGWPTPTGGKTVLGEYLPQKPGEGNFTAPGTPVTWTPQNPNPTPVDTKSIPDHPNFKPGGMYAAVMVFDPKLGQSMNMAEYVRIYGSGEGAIIGQPGSQPPGQQVGEPPIPRPKPKGVPNGPIGGVTRTPGMGGYNMIHGNAGRGINGNAYELLPGMLEQGPSRAQTPTPTPPPAPAPNPTPTVPVTPPTPNPTPTVPTTPQPAPTPTQPSPGTLPPIIGLPNQGNTGNNPFLPHDPLGGGNFSAQASTLAAASGQTPTNWLDTPAISGPGGYIEQNPQVAIDRWLTNQIGVGIDDQSPFGLYMRQQAPYIRQGYAAALAQNPNLTLQGYLQAMGGFDFWRNRFMSQTAAQRGINETALRGATRTIREN